MIKKIVNWKKNRPHLHVYWNTENRMLGTELAPTLGTRNVWAKSISYRVDKT